MSFDYYGLKSRFSDPVFTFQYYQALRYISSLLVSIILVRSGLPGEQLATYELWIFIVSVMTLFWSSGLRNALMSWYPSKSPEEQRSLIGGIFILMILASILLAAILAGFSSPINSLFTSLPLSDHSVMFSVWLAVSVPLAITEAILYLTRPAGELVYYAHWTSISQVLFFLAAGILAPEIGNFITALLLHSFLRFGYLTILIWKTGSFRPDPVMIRVFVLFSLPLVFNMLLGSTMDMIDGWFVSKFFNSGQFPVFRYGARELPFSSLLYSSLSAALIPVLVREGIRGGLLKQRATRLMHYLFPGTILLMPLSPFLFSWAYNESFRESAFIFNIYLLIMTSRVLLPQTVNFALYQHSVIVWSGILEIIANICLSYWWMHPYGIYGLAMATVTAYFLQKLILIVYNRVKNGIPFTHYIDLRYYVLYSVAAVSVFCAVHFYMR